MKKIIVINGKPESGKDTFVEFVSKHSPIPVFNFSTISTIKQAAIAYFGWTGLKDERSRKLLSNLKNAWVDYNDGPFNELVGKIHRFHSGIFFCHVREPPEIAKLKRYFGVDCLTLYIDRKTAATISNHADRDTEDYEYDTIIFNHLSIKYLEAVALSCLNQWIKKKDFNLWTSIKL